MSEPEMEKQKDQNDWLAADFAMGALEGEDLQRAKSLFENDLGFRHQVEAWQETLTPMLDDVEAVAPPNSVWQKIEGQIAPTASNQPESLWKSLNFWRGWSLVASGAAIAAIALLLSVPDNLQPDENSRPLVATLSPSGDAPALLARFNPQSGALVVRTSFEDGAEKTVPELWIIPGDGVPRSLGVLQKDGVGAFSIEAGLRENLIEGSTMAVSLEPEGGSPTGAPTGPVIAAGKLQFL